MYRWRNRLLAVQIGWFILAIWWLWKFSAWSVSNLTGWKTAPPTLLINLVIVMGGLITVWQMYRDKRRRAGTWYAVTDHRVLFVLTSVDPESVIGVRFEDIQNVEFKSFGESSSGAIVLRLNRMDPFLANSTVLAYLMSPLLIVLENVIDAREMHSFICRQIGHSTAGKSAR
jgi:hypothetical protein